MSRLSLVIAIAASTASCLPTEQGANLILHPWRRPLVACATPHEDVAFRSGDLTLRGWRFRGAEPHRLLVSLHGIGDNRRGAEGLALRFGPKGYDVLAWDSRAQGESDGTDCTYGFYEKDDVSRVLDAVGASRAILFGSSLGAAVALQAAAQDSRVVAVIAQSPYADLDSIIDDRAPWFATQADVESAKRLAEERGRFRMAEVSPVLAAPRIHVPVLLIHGESDRETRPAHSKRIFAALNEPRRLLLVPGAGHNDVLRGQAVWAEIESFLASLP